MSTQRNLGTGSPPFMTAVGHWFMDQLFSTPRLAHHPPCRCYDGHVLRLGRFVLCLGCTCMTAGMTVATAMFAWLMFQGLMGCGWQGVMTASGGGLILYLPTLIQPFCQWKPYKIAARFLLGMAVVAIIAGGLVLPPPDPLGLIARGLFVPTFWLVFKATLRQRARHTPDPCSRCRPAVYPFCEANRPRVASLLAELKRRARPGDEPFVAFASALAGEATAEAHVEVTSLWPVVAAGAGSEAADLRTCNGGKPFQPSGSSRPS